ncbi:MAG: hypothetical protein MTP17_04030 [Candidatus Midichloria sp.]|nr:MAG: hypothetical protein MTP17_04030 [Candidatus Midichloria sp.]
MVINGITAEGYVGWSASSAGRFNDDSKDDVVIGTSSKNQKWIQWFYHQ